MSMKEVVPERVGKREKIEWTDMWWDDPEKEGRRVLLVGDSITRGYYKALKKRMPEDIYLDRYVTSKALDNPLFIKELSYVLSQAKYEVIHFNNGLHGSLDTELFKELYEEIIKFLLKTENSPKIIVSGTTPVVVVDNPKEYIPFNKQSIERDKVAAEIAAKYNLLYENLYSVVDGLEGIRAQDSYHFNDKGCELLADKVYENLKDTIIF